MKTLALIGRPNVGKSTLFNRLTKKKLAIVDDTPGVTRDWRRAEGYLFDRAFHVIDTAGLEENFDDSIQGRMRKQTEQALDHTDVILFIVDGRSGITPLDQHFADYLRRQNKPVILAVNKAENEKAVQATQAEAYGLGLGEPVLVSSAHGDGMEDLYHALEPHMPEEGGTEQDIKDEEEFVDLADIEGNEEFEFEQEDVDPEKPIKIAIVGRPNVGKSTLLNAIVKDQRVMTGPEAGITRDAITVDWEYDGQKYKLVDTAGMRKKAKVQDNIEKMSVEDSFRAIRLAQVVLLVMDANMLLEKQDLQIAEHIVEEGRAIILVLNKWDQVKDKEEILDLMSYKLDTSFGQIKDIPYVTLSALNGSNIPRLFRTITQAYELWNRRVKTAGLNRWLARMESQNPAPLVDGRGNRLKFITQIKTRPPTFALWVSRPKELPKSYRRFIENGLRKAYDLPGTPIRLLVRASKNPYVK